MFVTTEIAKKVSFIPINEGQKNRILACAAALSTLAVVLNDVANGTLGYQGVSDLFLKISALASIWATAEGMHMARNWLKSLRGQ